MNNTKKIIVITPLPLTVSGRRRPRKYDHPLYTIMERWFAIAVIGGEFDWPMELR
jgi:hypothetical protein